MSAEDSKIVRPKPQRLFTTSPISSEPASPPNELSSPLSPPSAIERTRSVLNLTASTLYGIYAPDDDTSVLGYTPMPTNGRTTPAYPPTPSLLSSHSWDLDSLPQQGQSTSSLQQLRERERNVDRMAPVIGALERPQFSAEPAYQARQRAAARKAPTLAQASKGLLRAALLFTLGIAYGTVITHLHDARNVAPVKLDGLDRSSPRYMLFWGLAGILLGTALPVVDAVWEGEELEEKRERVLLARGQRENNGGADGGGADKTTDGNPLAEAVGLGAEWNPMVRSIGAFVGIGFAIRKLPWQSTLQASLTLGLVNPCLWYTIDRSMPGFVLSAAVGLVGTVILLGTEVVPMPAVVNAAAAVANGTVAGNASVAGAAAGALPVDQLVLGANQGTFAVWVWIASVLFCSCLCFGNIGRRLAVGVTTA